MPIVSRVSEEISELVESTVNLAEKVTGVDIDQDGDIGIEGKCEEKKRIPVPRTRTNEEEAGILFDLIDVNLNTDRTELTNETDSEELAFLWTAVFSRSVDSKLFKSLVRDASRRGIEEIAGEPGNQHCSRDDFIQYVMSHVKHCGPFKRNIIRSWQTKVKKALRPQLIRAALPYGGKPCGKARPYGIYELLSTSCTSAVIKRYKKKDQVYIANAIWEKTKGKQKWHIVCAKTDDSFIWHIVCANEKGSLKDTKYSRQDISVEMEVEKANVLLPQVGLYYQNADKKKDKASPLELTYTPPSAHSF